MHSRIRVRLAAGLFFMLAMLAPREALASSLAARIGGGEGATVVEQRVDGTAYLFLPSQASPEALDLVLLDDDGNTIAGTISASGSSARTELGAAPISLEGDLGAAPRTDAELGDSWAVSVYDEAGYWHTVNLKFSANVSSVFLKSDHGRSYVDSSPDHSAKDTGKALVLAPDGGVVYDGNLKQIKGRGNSTWNLSTKKPYQLKLTDKADLTQSGEASKTWILLANSADATLLRNHIALDLARALGISDAPSATPCDLYYDGEYRGSYLITEKVEVGKNRVEINDLDDANEEANEGNETWAAEKIVTGTNSYGYTYEYAEGGVDPSSISGGYLVEYDRNKKSDDLGFDSPFGLFTVKSPEPATEGEAKYVSERFTAAFHALVAEEPLESQSVLGEYFDLDALVRVGWFEELVSDYDYFRVSANYTLGADSDLIRAASPWDFDLAMRYGGTSAKSFHNFAKITLTQRPWLQKRCAAYQLAEISPLVRNVLLGSTEEASESGLRSIASYAEEIRASRQLDETIWGLINFGGTLTLDPVQETTFNGCVEGLKIFFTDRVNFLDAWARNDAGSWNAGSGYANFGRTWLIFQNGHFYTGWKKYGNAWYFFDRTYRVGTREWLGYGTDILTAKRYLIDNTGKMITGWEPDGGAWYYFDKDGTMHRGWLNWGTTKYYFERNGRMHTGWLTLGGKWYYLSPSGKLQTNQSVTWGGKTYWLGADGAAQAV